MATEFTFQVQVFINVYAYKCHTLVSAVLARAIR